MSGITAIADVEFELRWISDGIGFRERRFVPGVDLGGGHLAGHSLVDLAAEPPGQPMEIATGMLCGSRDSNLCFSLPRSAWPSEFGGHRIEPRRGRWLPRLMLAGHHGIASGDRDPLLIHALTSDTVEIDLNPPLAGRALTASARRLGPAPVAAANGSDLLRLLSGGGPGMQLPMASLAGEIVDEEGFARGDAGPDAAFYHEPRFVDHLDRVALAQLSDVHRRFLVPGMTVLDLMASCNSHLEPEPDIQVSGLGMNAAEMARNPVLSDCCLQDLNQQPRLPYADASFDLVLCALSVEYLVRPLEVFAEVARVLKPGGAFLVSFSERWFPPKAIRIWSELHPFERIGLVLDHFRRSGGFIDLHAESLRGHPRPRDDKYIRMTALSDPLYAVWGVRPD